MRMDQHSRHIVGSFYEVHAKQRMKKSPLICGRSTRAEAIRRGVGVSLKDIITQFMYFIRLPTHAGRKHLLPFGGGEEGAGTARCNLHGSLQSQINMQTETAHATTGYILLECTPRMCKTSLCKFIHFTRYVLDSILLTGLLLRCSITSTAHTHK
jgi:hypothetical protein